MSAENQSKVIKGRDRICRAYQFGKVTFYWLLTKDSCPIKKINGEYWVHVDDFDAFIRTMINDAPEAGEK
ncbi:MAG TPA: hypothetical protein PKN59_00390 [Syntrophales bacterium]|jgi:hypothetical protein|nr:hypothetical protein [Syntrophales bacterium]HNS53343.1 hypothetical protein [Syntrophales bacterium]